MHDTNTLSSITDNWFVQILGTIILTVGLQIVLHGFLDRIVHKTVQRHKYTNKIDEEKREQTLVKIFHTTSAVALWIIAVTVILFQLHVNVAGLLTGAGLIGVVAGLGAQNSIKDFLAGVFVIMENQYRVGDVVNLSANIAGGVSGVVEDISIRITKLRDMDGNLHIISNGSAGVVTNMTFRFANVNLDIPVSYHTDVEKVRKIINDVGIELAGDKVLGPMILEAVQFLRVDSFGPSVVTLKALGKVRPGSQWEVAGEFRLRLKDALSKHHIEIPYPQVVVYEAPKK